MADPFTVAVLGGKILGGIFKSKASKRRRRAARLRQQIGRIKNVQAKRKFLNEFLSAQGVSLARGALTGADLGSSAVQGQLASQRTQATTGLVEFAEMDRLNELANRNTNKANKLAGIASFASTVPQSLVDLGQELEIIS